MISKTNGLEKWMQEGSNVMVYNAPPSVVESISFGESTGVVSYCHSKKEMIEGIYWNEEFVSVRTMNGEIIRFEPELNPDVQIFFQRKTNYRDIFSGYVVWDGDYEKAKFTKKSLLDWLSRHVEDLDEDVRSSIRDMKVHERLDTQNITIGDVERTTEDEEMKTSIPKNFKANVRIAENWFAEMHFKAYVARNVDEYGRLQKGYNIVLELENAREIKRGFMEFVLKQVPVEIPVYYGKLKVLNVKRNEEL